MRKRIIAAVALALGGVLVLAVLNVNFLVRHNKDYLIGRVEQALGRKITVDKIEVTLSPVGARLVNFAMADDPAFSIDAFLLAKDLRVDFRFLPLLIGQFLLTLAQLGILVSHVAGQSARLIGKVLDLIAKVPNLLL